MCQGILITTSWGCLGGLPAGGRGNLGIEVGRGRFQSFGEVPQAVLRLIRAYRFLSPPILHLCLGLKVSLPGVVGVPMKVIVVHGELREIIHDVSVRNVIRLCYFLISFATLDHILFQPNKKWGQTSLFNYFACDWRPYSFPTKYMRKCPGCELLVSSS